MCVTRREVCGLIPALLVTRSSSKEDLGEEFIQQLTSKAVSLYVVSGFLVLMSFTGMPVIPLWGLALFIGSMGWVAGRTTRRALDRAQGRAVAAGLVAARR